MAEEQDLIAVVTYSVFTANTVRKDIIDNPKGMYESAPYAVRGTAEGIAGFLKDLAEKSGGEAEAFEKGTTEEIEHINATKLAEDHGVALILPGEGSMLRLVSKACYRFAKPGERPAGEDTVLVLEKIERLALKNGYLVSFDDQDDSWYWKETSSGNCGVGFDTRIAALKAIAERLND